MIIHLREIPVGGFRWRYISTVLHIYAERAASILPVKGHLYGEPE